MRCIKSSSKREVYKQYNLISGNKKNPSNKKITSHIDLYDHMRGLSFLLQSFRRLFERKQKTHCYHHEKSDQAPRYYQGVGREEDPELFKIFRRPVRDKLKQRQREKFDGKREYGLEKRRVNGGLHIDILFVQSLFHKRSKAAAFVCDTLVRYENVFVFLYNAFGVPPAKDGKDYVFDKRIDR